MTASPKTDRPSPGEPADADPGDELSEQLVAIQSALQDMRVVLTRGAQELARIRSVTPDVEINTVAEQAPPSIHADDGDTDPKR